MVEKNNNNWYPVFTLFYKRWTSIHVTLRISSTAANPTRIKHFVNDLVHAIQQVSRGGFYLSPGVSQAVVEAYRSRSGRPSDPLSSRERQVLQLIAEGKSTKDVASLLGISVKTAESHRSRIMKKLDIHETASLVRYAVRRGLVQP